LLLGTKHIAKRSCHLQAIKNLKNRISISPKGDRHSEEKEKTDRARKDFEFNLFNCSREKRGFWRAK